MNNEIQMCLSFKKENVIYEAVAQVDKLVSPKLLKRSMGQPFTTSQTQSRGMELTSTTDEFQGFQIREVHWSKLNRYET